MRVKGVGYHAMKFEINSNSDAVSGHQYGVLFHLFFGIVIFGFLVPGESAEMSWRLDGRENEAYHSYLSSPSLLASG